MNKLTEHTGAVQNSLDGMNQRRLDSTLAVAESLKRELTRVESTLATREEERRSLTGQAAWQDATLRILELKRVVRALRLDIQNVDEELSLLGAEKEK